MRVKTGQNKRIESGHSVSSSKKIILPTYVGMSTYYLGTYLKKYESGKFSTFLEINF